MNKYTYVMEYVPPRGRHEGEKENAINTINSNSKLKERADRHEAQVNMLEKAISAIINTCALLLEKNGVRFELLDSELSEYFK